MGTGVTFRYCHQKTFYIFYIKLIIFIDKINVVSLVYSVKCCIKPSTYLVWLAQAITDLATPSLSLIVYKGSFRNYFHGYLIFEAGFTLRCFQRLFLSQTWLPGFASGKTTSSPVVCLIPVLSSRDRASQVIQRPRRIGTELSH